MKYFDYAATTPLDPEAAEIFVKASTEFFGNSSSLHDIGGQSAALLEHCREEMAQLLGVDKQGLFFTSGGSEGNFLAIEALLSAPKKQGKHIIAGMAEHSSVHGILKRLEKDGYSITYLPFNSSGVIDPENLLNAIKPDTILAAIQHVNSEIGTIQPIEQLAKICTEHDIHFHTDMVQSFGKIDVRNITPLVGSFSFSGHKIYGPKGIGGAYVNPKIGWNPFFPGTSHEKGFRPGTVNVPAIAAMTTAAQKITGRIQENARRFVELRHAILNALQPISERVHVYQAEGDSQLPNIIGMRISGIEGQWMMLECNRLGFAISTGSACQIGMLTPAKVTQALGLTIDESKEFIRISFGHPTTMNEIEALGAGILKIANEFAVSSVI
ncbi:IscS subfamily cysteine desulfurase [Neobacillus rhizophilus]|uniref:IscS subfamily cysteine desulfurase n=1 Tax=Neobacillus rhizophilus TaxID=2833579 RepID=A0A942U691_9BACI|nr:IscS subfamily cysteine desulfurase [Neobacillus rhizophilus]MBS4215500.1 IscS subfamily cysteine desulfurase [Neobacillus rhizophilus]MBU8916604.1 IscS subfamily cysteine desulfurase [Bacillus sp. FJAT-29953]